MTALVAGCGGGGGATVINVPPGVNPVETGLGSLPQSGWTIQRTVEIQPKKKWTVIAFMNFANDLESYGILNLNQLEKLGSTADVNVVVQMKRIAGRFDNSNGDWGDTRRFYVTRDTDTNTLNSMLLSQNNNVDMGNPNELQAYINWAVRTFPADHYNLVIGNHGAGWRSVKTRSQKSPLTRGVSYDDTTGNHIDTIQFPAAVVHPEGKKWDLITMDCSLMQMVEVLYEWRDTADYIVGSEESPPGEGYAYDTTLARLLNTPSLTGRQLGIHYAQDATDRYNGRYDTTQSVVDTSLVGAIIPPLNDLGNTLNSLIGTRGADISLARADAQAYEYPENKDLLHFLDRLDFRIPTAQVQNKTAAVRSAAKAAIIFNATTGIYNPSSQGLAAFLPRPSQYTQIDIQQANGFGQRFSRLKLAADAPAWQTFLANGPS